MIIIPAVDIKNGKCVRLLQGRMDAETVYSDHPEAMALNWARLGAPLIHVIDLDGAFAKCPKNVKAIRKILASTNVPIQVGGGIRSQKTVHMYLEMGVRRVIIGSEAIKKPEFVKKVCKQYPHQIVIGIDARNGNPPRRNADRTQPGSHTPFGRSHIDSGCGIGRDFINSGYQKPAAAAGCGGGRCNHRQSIIQRHS
jgi:phosphoribosylformimino-5-aminoimidazole carboxamide ribotide isomerase